MATTRLGLALHPILPLRTAEVCAAGVTHGFELRVKNGPLLAATDPLLIAFGVIVDEVEEFDENDDALQGEAFDPGRDLQLTVELDVAGAGVVAMWDGQRMWRCGRIAEPQSAVVIAGLQHRLAYRAIALNERRSMPDERRTSLSIVLFAENFARLSLVAARHYCRSEQRPRRRIVLVAADPPGLRWWDNAVVSGPAGLDDLPLSSRLARAFDDLGIELKRLHAEADRVTDVYERFELEYEQRRLDRRTELLWQRTRTELAPDYVVGFFGRDMDAPVWSPADLGHHEEDDALYDE